MLNKIKEVVSDDEPDVLYFKKDVNCKKYDLGTFLTILVVEKQNQAGK